MPPSRFHFCHSDECGRIHHAGKRQRQRTDSTHVQDTRASTQSPHVRGRGHALCPRASSPLELSSGFWPRATPSGLTAMGTGLWSARLPQSQEEREAVGSTHRSRRLAVISRYRRCSCPCRAPVKSRRSRSCAAFGSKTTSGSRGSSTGQATPNFLPATSSSTRPMIKRHATAKSARQGGPVTSVNLSETGEEESPHLLTHVATTAATTTDEAMTETIHAELEH